MTHANEVALENAAASNVLAGAPERGARKADHRSFPARLLRPVPSRPGRCRFGPCIRSYRRAHPIVPAVLAVTPRTVRRILMFEGQSQSEVDAMIKSNTEFRQLYHRHKELDKQVLDAELGVLPIDDTRLMQMKREKLAAKDRLTQMFDSMEH